MPAALPAGRRFPARSRVGKRRWPAILLGFVLVLVAPAEPAYAHAQLLTTNPANGARLGTAPAEITLEFTERVNPVRDGVRLLDADGTALDAGPARVDATAPARLIVPVPARPGTGIYTVVWRVVSSDSHPIHGAFVFGVGDVQVSALPQTGAQAGADPAVSAAYWLIRWSGYAALALLLGGSVFLYACWPAGFERRRVRRLLAIGWGVSLSCAIVAVTLQSAYASGGSLADVADPARLGDTLGSAYGGYVFARIGLLAVAGVLLFVRGPVDRWRIAALMGVSALLPVTWVGTGHANAAASAVVAAADATHLLAMAVWFGGLVMLVGCVLPGAPTDEAAYALRRFSRLAAASVAVLVVTGTYQAWRGVGSLDALAGTEYGRLLVFKLAAIGVLLWFAAASRSVVQRRYVAPALADQRKGKRERDREALDRRRLRQSVRVEALLAVAVLGLTSLLVATPPGARPAALPAAPPVTLPQTAAAPMGGEALADLGFEGGRVFARLAPARTGPTTLTLAIRDLQGRPIDVPEVTARLSLAARNVGPLPVVLARRGPGQYESTGLTVPIAGGWQLELRVRTSEIDQYPLTTGMSIT